MRTMTARSRLAAMKGVLGSLCVMLALSAGATPAAAEGRVEFILDGSGSMWGDAGGESKVAAAKRVMRDFLQRIELPEDTKVGLTLYGHRRKGDCADIERLDAVDYAERMTLASAIDRLSPKGKTPIADSLQTVGDSLKGQEGTTSIVLVSDGIESCGRDPCAVARSLREQYGIEVTIHVVGFDVTEKREQLECIAEAGGGKFLPVSRAAELPEAIKVVETEIKVKAEAEPDPEPAADPEPEPEPINLAAAANGGQIILSSSAYSSYLAGKLIDEADAYWLSTTAAPQSIVLGFADLRRARIVDLLINPYNKQNQKRWAKDVEVYLSDESPYEGFRRVGEMTLEPIGSEQVLTLEPPVEGRYIKLNFMTSQGDTSHIGAGEVMLMGHLLEPDEHPGPPKNLAGSANGTALHKATSQYSSYIAANLIDGTQAYWLSKGAGAQDITLVFPGTAPQRVAAVAINPHNRQNVGRWAREVEVFASAKSSYKGYVSLGTIELKPVGEYQVLRFQEPAPAKYLRLRFLSNHGDSSHTGAGEVVVLED